MGKSRLMLKQKEGHKGGVVKSGIPEEAGESQWHRRHLVFPSEVIMRASSRDKSTEVKGVTQSWRLKV